MAVPNRISQLSQFWLPSLLFILSVVSILFTLRNDEIPVIGPNERSVMDSSDLEASRFMINQALQSSRWQNFCERRNETLDGLRFKNFDSSREGARWTETRRHLPQREQDALLRCQNATLGLTEGSYPSCLFLTPKAAGKNPGLYLVEMTMELRAQGKKKIFSCAEALAHPEQAIELVAWYSYYWTAHANKKPMRFERLTGGTRVFPPIAQNAEGSTASSRP